MCECLFYRNTKFKIKNSNESIEVLKRHSQTHCCNFIFKNCGFWKDSLENEAWMGCLTTNNHCEILWIQFKWTIMINLNLMNEKPQKFMLKN